MESKGLFITHLKKLNKHIYIYSRLTVSYESEYRTRSTIGKSTLSCIILNVLPAISYLPSSLWWPLLSTPPLRRPRPLTRSARAGSEEDDFGAIQIIVTRWQWRCTEHIF